MQDGKSDQILIVQLLWEEEGEVVPREVPPRLWENWNTSPYKNQSWSASVYKLNTGFCQGVQGNGMGSELQLTRHVVHDVFSCCFLRN